MMEVLQRKKNMRFLNAYMIWTTDFLCGIYVDGTGKHTSENQDDHA